MGQTASDRRLFLFPEQIDLVVLGSADGETIRTLKELLGSRRIGMLILSEKAKTAGLEELAQVRETVALGGGTFHTESVGWHFLAKSLADGTVALAHGLSADTPDDMFADCVMSVKALREGLPCQKELSPDGYGCALGCALYQDYDVCKYREGDGKPAFRTGTLLFGGGEDEAACSELLEETRDCIGAVRFFGLSSGRLAGNGDRPGNRMSGQRAGAAEQAAALRKLWTKTLDTAPAGFRRYLIGTEELDSETTAELCHGGWYQRPVVLREGEGICCSGLLKYGA